MPTLAPLDKPTVPISSDDLFSSSTDEGEKTKLPDIESGPSHSPSYDAPGARYLRSLTGEYFHHP